VYIYDLFGVNVAFCLHFLEELEFEIRALCLLGKCSNTLAMPLCPFCFELFFIWVLILSAQAGLRTLSSYLYLPYSWDYSHKLPCLVCFWDRVSLTLLPRLSSNHNAPMCASHIARWSKCLWCEIWVNISYIFAYKCAIIPGPAAEILFFLSTELS
jgi:hypothetical protein